jgi:hypothetical protein
MGNAEFQEMLTENRHKPLYGDWLTKYQHVERLGSPEVEGLLDGVVTVQTKIDGANLTVAWDHDADDFVIASRNHAIYHDGEVLEGFNGAVEYVKSNAGAFQHITQDLGWILRGEWLVRHSVNYAADKMKKLYVFDVQEIDDGMSYVEPRLYIPILEEWSIPYIPTLTMLDHPTPEVLAALVLGPDTFGAEQKEGVVVKRYGFVNRWGRTVWAKLVAADFKEKNKLAFGATKNDPVELRFAATVTDEAVMKVIHKIADERGVCTVKQMGEVLGRLWYDVFMDNLWAFVKKEKVTTFNFNEARRLVETKARTVALDYFNGMIPAAIVDGEEDKDAKTI